MHDRLFDEKPPSKNYPENFPSKTLRHLGSWTFYSTPTNGEIALLDKNMYHLGKDTENTGSDIKAPTAHDGNINERKLQDVSNYKKGPEASVTRTTKVDLQKQEVNSPQKEKSTKILKDKSSFTSKSRRSISQDSNFLQNIKHAWRAGWKHNVEKEKNTIIRQSSFKNSINRQRSKIQISNRRSPLSEVGLKLKKSRGKVLGGAHIGLEIDKGGLELTVEGYNMLVPETREVQGKADKCNGDTTRALVEEVLRNHNLNQKSFTKKENNPNCGTASPDMHRGTSDGGAVSLQKPTTKVKSTVIKIPLQENERMDENDTTVSQPVNDLGFHSTGDNLELKTYVKENDHKGEKTGICCDFAENEETQSKHFSIDKGKLDKKKRHKSSRKVKKNGRKA